MIVLDDLAAPARSHELGNTVFYLCNIGGYDDLSVQSRELGGHPLAVVSDTEPNIECHMWIRPTLRERDLKRLSLWYKTHPHVLFPTQQTTVWMDSNVSIKPSGLRILEGLAALYEVSTFAHPDRNCVFQEGLAVQHLDLDHADVVKRHLQELKRLGMPRDWGLFETNVLVLALQQWSVQRLLDTWWRLIATGSRRDQMSFTPAAFLSRVEVQPIDGSRNARLSPHFDKDQRHQAVASRYVK